MKQLKQVLAKTKSGSLYEQLQNLAIIDKGGRMMPLVPNWAQRELIGALSEQAKRPSHPGNTPQRLSCGCFKEQRDAPALRSIDCRGRTK